jgi:tetratricopeptide (TPR) repeat protein
MAGKRNLGIGLDILLTANQSRQSIKAIIDTSSQVQSWYDQALEYEERGNIFEAYHLYRQIIDLFDNIKDTGELAPLVSYTCNNLAVILFEAGQTEQAVSYLQQAIDIYPKNQTAIDNMKLVSK